MTFSHSLKAQPQAKLHATGRGTMTTRIARVPYLNSVPFFRGLALGDRYELTDCVPRQLGEQAAAGTIAAGPLPLMEYFRLHGAFERLGHFGIAVRGQAHSALLFAMKPIRQLDGATIVITEETSTTVCLLRVLLECRYRMTPAAYERRRRAEPRTEEARGSQEHRQGAEADALLLIGDEALRFRQINTRYPFEIDLGFEWWLWQHLPFVFAVWAIREGTDAQERKRMESSLARSLGTNLAQVGTIAEEYSQALDMSPANIETYLSGFVYRLGPTEEEGIRRFRELVDECHLL